MTDRWCFTCKTHRPDGHEHPPSLFDAPTPPTTAVIDRAPGRVRTGDYPTSRAGADDVAYRSGSQKARLLVEYRRAGADGLTDDEAAHRAGIPAAACYWKRCGELRDAGMIAPTGDERMGSAGVPRIVCRVTARGATA